MVIVKTILFIFFLFMGSSSVWALPIETCRNQNINYHSKLSVELDELDSFYTRYRWAEARIRRMYYDNIWEARILGNDPLDSLKRDKGQELEKKYLALLMPLKRESESLSNGFIRMIEKIKQMDQYLTDLCERRDVQTCLFQAYEPFYKMMDQAREVFFRIFEHERVYRTAVENSSGGRDGLYPEDALEPAGEHTDFYWRFEQPKSQERFEDDAEMMRLIMAAKQFIYLGDTGEECCRQCV